MKKIVLLPLYLVLVIFLTSCGSSSGGSSGGSSGDGTSADSSGIKYTGATAQVSINEENAEPVATNAYENTDNMSKPGSFMGAVSTSSNNRSGTPGSIAIAQAVYSFFEQVDLSTVAAPNYSQKMISESSSEAGTCGGNFSLKGQADDATGDFDMTVTFNNYCTNGNGTSTGTVMSGNMNMSGKINMSTNAINASITFSKVTVSLLNTGVTSTISGSMTLSVNSSNMTITMNMVMLDGASGKTYMTENFKIDMYNITGSSAYLTMSGRFYDHDYGYSDISTGPEFYIKMSDNMPSSGTLLVEGSNGTKTKLIIINQYTYHVQADTNGDGTYDHDTGTLNW